MLPSVSEFDLDYPYLRSHWENIAVLDDELHVQDDKTNHDIQKNAAIFCPPCLFLR